MCILYLHAVVIALLVVAFVVDSSKVILGKGSDSAATDKLDMVSSKLITKLLMVVICPSKTLTIMITVIIVASLQNPTIEYSSEFLYASICVCVCVVCVFFAR